MSERASVCVFHWTGEVRENTVYCFPSIIIISKKYLIPSGYDMFKKRIIKMSNRWVKPDLFILFNKVSYFLNMKCG